MRIGTFLFACAWFAWGVLAAVIGNALLDLRMDPEATGLFVLAFSAYRIAREKSS